MNAATSTNNYEYLDILDRAWADSGLQRPAGGVVCDVGSASFWYAAALHAFFRPRELVGVEVEGHRLFKDGHSPSITPPATWVRYRVRGSWWRTMSIASCRPT